MSQNIVSYTSRDYDSIKQDLINAIPNLTDIWTNREAADPGMVLITEMAALGDNLSFNMDKQSLEFFAPTVTQRKNAMKVFDLIGYKMHWYESAKLEVTIYNNSEQEELALLFNESGSNTQRIVSSSVANAPSYLLLYPNETASNWNTDKIISIPAGGYKTFDAVQGALQSITFSSTAIDDNNRFYLSNTKIDQNHIWLKDDQQYQWYLVDNINEMTETLPRFQFRVDEYNLPYIEFVPYWTTFGEAHSFTLYFLATRGTFGNVTANILDQIPGVKSLTENLTYESKNILISHGNNTTNSDNLKNIPGKDPQTAKEAYFDSRKYLGVYNTLVTLPDFEKFMLRQSLISSVKAVDGQLADEYNTNIPQYNKLISSIPTEFKEYKNFQIVGESANYKYNDWIESKEPKFELLHKFAISEGAVARVLYEDASGNEKSFVLSDGEFEISNDSIVLKPVSSEKNITIPSGTTYQFNLEVTYLSQDSYKPYSLDLHMVAGDFLTGSDIDVTYKYATETAKKIENDDGYIEYSLTDSIIGASDDSLVSQSGLDKYKLFTADVNYGSVRKFPVYVDGKIHLKNPVRPAEANLVLTKVFNAIRTYFNTYNLTMGEKIRFRDIISVVMAADESIEYFDAGANNEHGSLIVYPQTDDYNPNTLNVETGNYKSYGLNINPKYFNLVSLQHYEDMLQANSQLCYWGNTLSEHLSIDEESISEKYNPIINNILVNISVNSEDDDKVKITMYPQPNVLRLFEFRMPKTVVINSDYGELKNIQDCYSQWTENNVEYITIVTSKKGNGIKFYEDSEWSKSNTIKDWDKDKTVSMYIQTSDPLNYRIVASSEYVENKTYILEDTSDDEEFTIKTYKKISSSSEGTAYYTKVEQSQSLGYLFNRIVGGYSVIARVGETSTNVASSNIASNYIKLI